MRAFHDSRNTDYRAPYGALPLGSAVEITLDIWEAPGVSATLRTWVDGDGEARYPMTAVEQADGDQHVRFRATLKPETEGAVWYQFIIAHPEGWETRYGAQDGKLGGEGRLCDWEPPSFKLQVYDPKQLEDGTFEREASLRFRKALDGFLNGASTALAFMETLEELQEECPRPAFEQAADLLDEPEETIGQWSALGLNRDAIVQNAIDLRHALPLFQNGRTSWFAANDNVLGFWCQGEDAESACVLINASPHDTHDVLVPMESACVSDVVSGYGVPVADSAEIGRRPLYAPTESRFARIHLPQLGSAVLYFHESPQLEKPLDAGVGVLVHITSLPSSTTPGQPGTMGAQARSFVDQLADAGVRYWQVLPVNPTDDYGSPYAGISAFAGNPLLIDGASAEEIARREPQDAASYRRFCKREADWLEPYAAFMALKQKFGADRHWQNWPEEFRAYDPALIYSDDELSANAEGWRRVQFAFEEQWKGLLAYANERGVQIVGDMPIYVSEDSADVWANPSLFQLDEGGRPAVVAGCPPDAFAPEGQVWGNPVYDWNALRASGYDWWLRRLGRALELYDVVRLDHFIGFARYFAIPAGGNASEGSYHAGPGMDFFSAAYEVFGPLPIIAEDLGLITPAVRALVAACGFPGMDIVQFVDGGDPLGGYQPRPNKIVYTGTHDNQTLVGYAAGRYPDLDAMQTAKELMRKALTSSARICVVPLQDVLDLDDDARMNVPGTAEGNWKWQADADALEQMATRLRDLVALRT